MAEQINDEPQNLINKLSKLPPPSQIEPEYHALEDAEESLQRKQTQASKPSNITDIPISHVPSEGQTKLPPSSADDKIKNILSLYEGSSTPPQNHKINQTDTQTSFINQSNPAPSQHVYSIEPSHVSFQPNAYTLPTQFKINAPFQTTNSPQTTLTTSLSAPVSPQPSKNHLSREEEIYSQLVELRQQQREQMITIQEQVAQQNVMYKSIQPLLQSKLVDKDVSLLERMEASFSKLTSYLDSIDKRLSVLEQSTLTLLKSNNTHVANGTPNVPPKPADNTSQQSLNQENGFSYPSLTSLPPTSSQPPSSSSFALVPVTNVDTVKQSDQYEEDRKLAEKLQAELNEDSKPTPKPAKPAEISACPICSKSFPRAEIEKHVNECVDIASKQESQTTKADQQAPEKPGIFQKVFGRSQPTQQAQQSPHPQQPKQAQQQSNQLLYNQNTPKPPTPQQAQANLQPTYTTYQGSPTIARTNLPTPVPSATVNPHTTPVNLQSNPPSYAQPPMQGQGYANQNVVYRGPPMMYYGYPPPGQTGSNVQMMHGYPYYPQLGPLSQPPHPNQNQNQNQQQ